MGNFSSWWKTILMLQYSSSLKFSVFFSVELHLLYKQF
ncbi:unnamed protein product [Larinioides sclopetarius]|uniref:Uncharacterized protein n=1 Tax=Larinioides sclopetarius TaxID=280406 RepID=A0AAV1YZA6_9ARAC